MAPYNRLVFLSSIFCVFYVFEIFSFTSAHKTPTDSRRSKKNCSQLLDSKKMSRKTVAFHWHFRLKYKFIFLCRSIYFSLIFKFVKFSTWITYYGVAISAVMFSMRTSHILIVWQWNIFNCSFKEISNSFLVMMC